MINENFIKRVVGVLLELKVNPGLRADMEGDVGARIYSAFHGGEKLKERPKGADAGTVRYRAAANRIANRRIAMRRAGS